jgi:hypothetical protein
MATPASSDRRLPWAIAGLSLLTSVPYAVLGPYLLLDDWFTLWFRMRDGILWTGGHGQLSARPGAFLVLLVQYGVIGAHPLVLYLLQAALAAAAAALLFVAGRRLLGPGRAFAVAAVWVLLPNHSSIDRWAAALPALVSLVLLLAGVVVLERAVERGGSVTAAVALLCASALCYEASLAPGALALLAVPWLMERRPDLRDLAMAEVPLVLTGAWMFAHSQHRSGDFSGWFDFARMVQAHMGVGLNRPEGLMLAVLVVGLIGTMLALARPVAPSLRSLPEDATRLVLAGLVVIGAGTVAFARYPIAPLGLGDRANVVASVGTALLWVGIGTALWDRRRAVGVAAAAAFALVLLLGRVERDVDYTAAGDDAKRILAALDRTYPSRPPGVVVVGPKPVFHYGIVGLIGPLDQAVRADSGDRTRRARVASDPDDFRRVPPELRLDTRDVLSP